MNAGGLFLRPPLPGPTADRSMSSSLSASQLHTVNMRDPLNRVLGESSHCAAAGGVLLVSLHSCYVAPSPRPLALPSPPDSHSVPLHSFAFHASSFGRPHLGGILSTSFLLLSGATTTSQPDSSQPLLTECSLSPHPAQPTCSCSFPPSWARGPPARTPSLCSGSWRSVWTAWSRAAAAASCSSCPLPP